MSEEIAKVGGRTVIVVQAAPIDENDAINLADVFSVLWRYRSLVLILSAVTGAIFAISASLSEPVYRSEALVTVVTERGGEGLGSLTGALGSLASVAGVNLELSEGRRAEYVSMLSSRSVARDFITEQNLLPLLYPSRWDAQANAWRSTWLHRSPPTLGQAVKRFHKNVLKVTDDEKTGLLTVAIELPSRERSAELANRLVALVNERVRAADIQRSQRGIEYLNRELDRTNAIGVKQGIFRLIESNLSRITMANVEDQYAFRTIDAAIAPEPGQHARPQSVLQTALGLVLGGLLGVAVALWRGRADWSPAYRQQSAG